MQCRNTSCGERLDADATFGFCPSCWMAGKVGARAGAILAFAFMAGWQIVGAWPWLTWTKKLLGLMFN